MEKTCKRCGEVKALNLFYAAPACRDGRRGECVKCVNEKQRIRMAIPENKARMKAYHGRQDVRDRQNASRRSQEGKISYWRRAQASPSFMLSFALYRALKRRPSDSPVTHAELMVMYEAQGGLCALSGVRMTWMQGKIRPTSMSIDRIDSTKGYTQDNVRLVCHSINRMKGDATDEDVYQLALALVANMKRPKLRLVG